MAVLLPLPEIQPVDGIGAPYAAGTIETYITGTTTPKATWNDPAGGDSHLNANPVVLDSAGRAILYGDGNYRLVLRDAAGNLIYDQPSSTLVSAAMAPVIIAPTIPDAVALLGIQDLIDAAVAVETARAEAAESALSAAIASEATTRAAADTTLTTALAAETTRAEAAEAALAATIAALPSTGVEVRSGSITTDVDGRFDVTFSPAFATAPIWFVVFDPAATAVPVETPSGHVDTMPSPFLYTTEFFDTMGNQIYPNAAGITGAGVIENVQILGVWTPQAVTMTTLNWLAIGY